MKKTILFILAIPLLFAGCGTSKNMQLNNNTLTGIWRTYHNINPYDSIDNVYGRLEAGDLHKILDANGQLTLLLVQPRGSKIVGYGTYTILSPTEYVEHVEQLYTNHDFSGKDNKITVKFVDDNTILVTYGAGTVNEIWKRVERGIP
ncbi:MAG: DUF4488 domain-containing protein [Tannerella sp.]|jgi:hypothetical protein|nr:DUF4488 domain-containing protein [Tannerella sp.]